MHKIIYDCDNTIGIKGRDVDDGITLLYLLGRKDIELLGVTTTHGNGTVEEVYKNTYNMFNSLNIKSIPLLKGSEPKDLRKSDASEFLLNMVKKNPKEVTILATGSLSNLYGAYLKDNNFFNYVKEIVLMGGILEPLIISSVKVDELNFSCDREASYNVLSKGKNISIINGHTSLQAVFGEKEIEYIRTKKGEKIFDFLLDGIENWYSLMYDQFKIKGFCNWDAAAAIYITNPELFSHKKLFINPSLEDLSFGYLKPCEDEGNLVSMPDGIKDLYRFNEVLIKSLENLI